MGLMACGSSIGGVVLPIFLEKLLPKIGFEWTMRAAACMILGLLVSQNFGELKAETDLFFTVYC